MASISDTLVILPAASFGVDRLVQAFNDGYIGYQVPVHVDTLEFDHHVHHNDIDLDASRVAVQQDAIVGIGLLGIRDQHGWIGGLGVHPDHRHQGIGHTLMAALLDAAQAAHLTAVQLEVMEGNTAAHALYQKLGFREMRRLHVLGDQPHPPKSVDDSLVYEPGTLKQMLDLHRQFHAAPPPWQRGWESLSRLDSSAYIEIAHRQSQPLAYVVGIVTSSLVHLLDLACAPGHDDTLANLMAHIQNAHPEAAGRIVNVGEDEAACKVLLALGWQTILTQYEMHLAL